MTVWKRFWLLLPAVAVVVALGTVSVFAQDGGDAVSFENVRLWLYPEYDDPRLLVMLEGEIVGVDLPATVRFLVPETAVMYFTGSVDEVDGDTGGLPDRVPSGVPGWDEISYRMTATTFRVEYYDDIIQGSPDRSIGYQFRALYPIADLKVYVLEPSASRDYSATGLGEPSPASNGESDERFVAHAFTYQNLATADVLDFQIAYTRSTSQPSLVLPVDPSAADGDDVSTGVVVAVVTAVLIVLAGGVFWRYRVGSAGQRRPVSRVGSVRRHTETVPPVTGKVRAARFCTSCRESLSSGDRFCSSCGARIE